MKKNLIFLSFVSIILLSGCGNSGAQLYHDNIYDVTRDCLISRNDVFRISYSENPQTEDILNAINSAIASCQSSKETIEKLWNYKKDSSFKDAVIDYLSADIQYLTLYSESSKFRNLETLTEEDSTEYQTIYAQLIASQEELMSALESLTQSQKEFASKYDVKLEKNLIENSDQQNEDTLDQQWSVETGVDIEVENTETNADINSDTNSDIDIDTNSNTDSNIDVENEEVIVQESIENIE